MNQSRNARLDAMEEYAELSDMAAKLSLLALNSDNLDAAEVKATRDELHAMMEQLEEDFDLPSGGGSR